MPLDYSKWDKLELSDDSDIEVHPNVDKRSMIKWKREAIHREREERNQRIAYLEQAQKQQTDALDSIRSMISLLNDKGPDGARAALNEQSKQLASRLQDKNLGAAIQAMTATMAKEELESALKSTLQKVEQSHTDTSQEFEKLKKEASKKMTSENMFHETANRTIINKPKPTQKKKETVVETLNPGVQMADLAHPGASASTKNESLEDDDSLEMSEEAAAFSKIKTFAESYKFIQQHNVVIDQADSISDSILTQAFEAQMRGDEDYAKNCIRQATILSYCELDPNHVTAFFKRMETPDDPRCRKFFDDVEAKYQHVKKRSREMMQASEEMETIQLQPMNPDSQPTVRIPDATKKEEQEAYRVYHNLPEPFRKALETADLDIINKALEKIDAKEAEQLVEICSNYGFLDVDGDVIDETGAKPSADTVSKTSGVPLVRQ